MPPWTIPSRFGVLGWLLRCAASCGRQLFSLLESTEGALTFCTLACHIICFHIIKAAASGGVWLGIAGCFYCFPGHSINKMKCTPRRSGRYLTLGI